MRRIDLIRLTTIVCYTILFLKYITPIIGIKYTFMGFLAISLSFIHIKLQSKKDKENIMKIKPKSNNVYDFIPVSGEIIEIIGPSSEKLPYVKVGDGKTKYIDLPLCTMKEGEYNGKKAYYVIPVPGQIQDTERIIYKIEE